jgi:hypothetical protein
MFAYVLAMTHVLPMFYLYISPNFCASAARASAQSDKIPKDIHWWMPMWNT